MIPALPAFAVSTRRISPQAAVELCDRHTDRYERGVQRRAERLWRMSPPGPERHLLRDSITSGIGGKRKQLARAQNVADDPFRKSGSQLCVMHNGSRRM